jgi:hypothetical protein
MTVRRKTSNRDPVKERLKGSDAGRLAPAGRRTQPGAQDAGSERKAVDESGNVDAEKLRRNQERLRVDEKHKTPEMKKGHRGTFP